MNIKKFRVLWNEKTNSIPESTCSNIKYSFDGVSWIDCSDYINVVKTSQNIGNYGATTTDNIDDTGYKQFDITLTPNVVSIPEITEVEKVLYSGTGDNSEFLTPGTYFICVASTNYPNIGKFSTINNNVIFSSPISNIKKFVVNVGELAKPNIYVRYPDYIKGLYIYIGEPTVADATKVLFKLREITSVTNYLDVKAKKNSQQITLKNKLIFPKKGFIKIDSEIMEYTNCTYESGKYKLILKGVVTSEHNADSVVYFVINNIDQYSTNFYIPKRLYPINNVNDTLYANLAQYLHFDFGTPKSLVKNNSDGEVLGVVEYSTVSMLKSSLKLNGKGCVNSKIKLTLDGQIHFYFMISEIPTENMYLFGSKTGLWVRINKDKLKVEYGYKNTTLMDASDPRLDYINVNTWNELGLGWDSNSEATIVYFYYNGRIINENILTKDSKLGGNDNFSTDNIYIGAIKLEELNDDNLLYEDCFVGYIDDWKIYNKALTELELNDINDKVKNYTDYFCGKIELTADLPDYTATDSIGSGINIYAPKSFEELLTDSKFNSSQETETEYRNYFDYQFIPYMITNQAITGGTESSPLRITYPLFPSTIKYMVVLNNGGSSNLTPEITKFISIISDVDISFL